MSTEERFANPRLPSIVYTRREPGHTRRGGRTIRFRDGPAFALLRSVDELNSVVGVARRRVCPKDRRPSGGIARIQHALFNLGTVFATLPEDLTDSMPQVTETDVEF